VARVSLKQYGSKPIEVSRFDQQVPAKHCVLCCHSIRCSLTQANSRIVKQLPIFRGSPTVLDSMAICIGSHRRKYQAICAQFALFAATECTCALRGQLTSVCAAECS
jgi:hypothetical protein